MFGKKVDPEKKTFLNLDMILLSSLVINMKNIFLELSLLVCGWFHCLTHSSFLADELFLFFCYNIRNIIFLLKW